MADWTTLADGLFDPGKPILGSTQISQRDNYISITEGATGAPRVQANAMGGSVAGDTLLFSALGDGVEYTTSPTVGESDEQSFIVPGSFFRAYAACEVRVKAQALRAVGNGTITLRIYKNSTVAVSLVRNAGTYDDLTPTDISLVAGDTIRAEIFVQGGTGGSAATSGRVRNLTLSTGLVRPVGGT